MFKKIEYNTYILDLDRINQLTAHPNDNPSNSVMTSGFVYTHTRKILKEYLELYTEYNNSNNSKYIEEEKYLKVCEVLHYNRILVSQADIRDKRLDNVLKDEHKYPSKSN